MSDEPPIWQPQRHQHVLLDKPRDIQYWAGIWGLSDQELRDAVAAVGSLAADVAAHLGQPVKGENLGAARGRPAQAT